MAVSVSGGQSQAATRVEGAEPIEVKQSANRAMERRLELRGLVWGQDVEGEIWNKREKGFCTIPRTLPLVGSLIRLLTRNVDASRVYFDLWSRQYEDGFIDIQDEQEIAASCGYANGSRGVRSWREAMTALEDLGFVRAKPKGTRKFGYVLLPHPHDIVVGLIESKGAKIPDWWKGLFYRRIIEVGTRLRNG